MGLDPGTDPDRRVAVNPLLFVGHCPRHVHHVDDHRHRLRLLDLFPAAILLVGPDGHDDRIDRVVRPRRDLPLHGPLEGALEVAQRLRAGLADAGVAVAGRDDVLLAARLDARQGPLLAADGGHLLHGQLDLEDVPALLVAGAAAGLTLARPQRLTGLAWPRPHTAGALLAVAERRRVDLRQGDAHQVLALLADHLAAA